MGSSFGRVFRVTTWGESHGKAVGVVIDGCPPRLPVTADAIQAELDRRRPGQSDITTQRREPDRAEILSGVQDGLSLGTPIAILVQNQNAKSRDYDELAEVFRPSHADYTYEAKLGIRAWQGGGRASARETVGRVAAGAVAKRLLADLFGVEILGWVQQVWQIAADVDVDTVTAADVEATAVRCPDPAVANRMIERIKQARKQGDSVGGVVQAVARHVPPGLGEPVFDKLEADLGKALLSIPACKGFEVGSGFGGVTMTGAAHNDPFYVDPTGAVRTRTNFSGGIQGGITNGEPIVLRAAFKPTATIATPQQTINRRGESVLLAGRGRHDPCVVPRAVPIVEAMIAIVLADHALRQRGQVGRFANGRLKAVDE